jgi:hypothetical protein
MKTPKIVSSKMIFVLIAILSTCTFAACSKDEDDPQTPEEIDFEEIQFLDIKAKELELSSSSLLISDAVGIHFKADDILFYKTSLGRYGKMKIILVNPDDNYKFSFTASTYESNGTLFSGTSSAEVRGTWLYDLDQMEELDGSTLNGDFWNERINATDTYLTPKNEASFLRFSTGK